MCIRLVKPWSRLRSCIAPSPSVAGSAESAAEMWRGTYALPLEFEPHDGLIIFFASSPTGGDQVDRSQTSTADAGKWVDDGGATCTPIGDIDSHNSIGHGYLQLKLCACVRDRVRREF